MAGMELVVGQRFEYLCNGRRLEIELLRIDDDSFDRLSHASVIRFRVIRADGEEIPSSMHEIGGFASEFAHEYLIPAGYLKRL